MISALCEEFKVGLGNETNRYRKGSKEGVAANKGRMHLLLKT